jgi:hypothetical protein
LPFRDHPNQRKATALGFSRRHSQKEVAMLYIIATIIVLYALSENSCRDREQRQVDREWERDEAMGLHHREPDYGWFKD